MSNDFFRGEEEREIGFRSTIRSLDPERTVLYLPASDGLDRTTLRLMGEALNEHPGISAVYSIGGGNVGTLQAFEAAGRKPSVFIGHDLVPTFKLSDYQCRSPWRRGPHRVPDSVA
ncbi:hypothetical protein [Arthrobacter sp. Rue61a]|uniref:hypothetical protein n=1 Tax=Arthrobacter sp. Rue61a TaxID=1118963 RepID=UPI00027DF1D1|nr:hypothetical protein [Arthrobacter sp. Rue61a]AFR30505.1 hypothetical protein ARUE_c36260 [Arthrobacter sp. Rue61a]